MAKGNKKKHKKSKDDEIKDVDWVCCTVDELRTEPVWSMNMWVSYLMHPRVIELSGRPPKQHLGKPHHPAELIAVGSVFADAVWAWARSNQHRQFIYFWTPQHDSARIGLQNDVCEGGHNDEVFMWIFLNPSINNYTLSMFWNASIHPSVIPDQKSRRTRFRSQPCANEMNAFCPGRHVPRKRWRPPSASPRAGWLQRRGFASRLVRSVRSWTTVWC